MTENKAPPALGTPEAAVRSCVSLLSMLFSQPEDAVAYYLDLYYQVRCAYERADGQTPQSQPAAATAPLTGEPGKGCHANAAAPARNDAENGGPPRASAPTESAKEGGEAEKTAPPPRKSTLSGFEPVAVRNKGGAPKGNTNGRAAAIEKRRIRERLLAMRAAGLTTPAIVKAADGAVTEDSVLAIIEAHPVPVAVYRVLDATLDGIESAKS